ncbi:Uncharacterised protein [Serratia odorifera]|uniref:Uncharacterized protein n=1 Tax=Serratia odorifera TaxID=618 RepID=A0A447KPR9_SEROD|nr:Uncharacterised protein [Serratia odorifera]
MFANCQLMGMDLAFPDVCLTPTPHPDADPLPGHRARADRHSQRAEHPVYGHAGA